MFSKIVSISDEVLVSRWSLKEVVLYSEQCEKYYLRVPKKCVFIGGIDSQIKTINNNLFNGFPNTWRGFSQVLVLVKDCSIFVFTALRRLATSLLTLTMPWTKRSTIRWKVFVTSKRWHMTVALKTLRIDQSTSSVITGKTLCMETPWLHSLELVNQCMKEVSIFILSLFSLFLFLWFILCWTVV